MASLLLSSKSLYKGERSRAEIEEIDLHNITAEIFDTDGGLLITANFGEIGRLFGVKTAGCSGKSATPGWRRTKVQFSSISHHFQSPPCYQFS